MATPAKRQLHRANYQNIRKYTKSNKEEIAKLKATQASRPEVLAKAFQTHAKKMMTSLLFRIAQHKEVTHLADLFFQQASTTLANAINIIRS